MYIFIRTTNKTIALEVDSNLRIEDVKEQFEYQEGFRRDQYSLLYSGQKLENDNTISSYNIPYGGIIHFNREYILVFVEVFEEKMLHLKVNPSESIKKIRSDILSQTIYFENEIRDFPLYSCGVELDDGTILSDYDIKEGMTLASKNPNSEYLLIVIEELYKNPFALYVFPESRVENVKSNINKIQNKKDYRSEGISLFFSNNELKDRSILSDYNVRYGDALRLERVKESMIIYIHHSIFYILTGIFESVFLVNQSDIIRDIKSKIKSKFGFTHYQQDLWYDEHPLEEDRTLESYNIPDQSKLVLSIYSIENILPLVINNFNGDIFIVEVKLNDIIENVKAAIQTKKCFPKDKQRLALDGEFLKDSCTLLDYGIGCWDGLHLYPMNESYFNIFINENDNNESNFPLIVKSSYIIENVKEEIQYRKCSPLSLVHLYRSDEELEDGKTLLYYNINSEAILNLQMVSDLECL